MDLEERREDIDVSVVLPTMDEEKTIGTCLEKIQKVFEEEDLEGEIIVSDSSTDRTPEIAEEYGAKVVCPQERGYGNAYLEGLSKAQGGIVVMGDADDTYDFLEMPKFLRPLMRDECEIVMGDRLENLDQDSMSLPHKIGQPIMNGLLKLFHGTNVSDAHCGFRAFTRESLERMNLKAGGMDFASELVIEQERKNFDVKEVPIKLHPRPEGSEATYNYFSDSWDHLKLIMLRAPTRAFAIPGFVLLALGVLFWLGSFPALISLGPKSAVLGAIFMMAGIQMFGAGVFVRLLGIQRNMVDHDRLSKAFKEKLTPARGFWIGLVLFVAGVLLALPIGIGGTSIQQSAMFFMMIALGIEIGSLSVVWDLVRG